MCISRFSDINPGDGDARFLVAFSLFPGRGTKMHTHTNTLQTAAHLFPLFDSNTPLTQAVIDGCKLIGIKELSIQLKRSEATIRTQVTREPWKLPPRFPGTSQVLWMWSVVIAWQINEQSKILNASKPAQITQNNMQPSMSLSTNRRGAPTKKEKAEAKASGFSSVAEWRASNSKSSN